MTDPHPAQGPARQLLDTATLPCGTEVDPLFEQAADGHAQDLDAHQRDCVHCQAALRELAALWAPVSAVAGSPVEVPAGLTTSVMSQLRTLVRGVWYSLEATGLGGVRIAARIVAAIARDSARAVPGVQVALGRSTDSRLAAVAERATFRHRHPNAAVGVLGGTAVVDLAIAVSYGEPVHLIARNVQRRVIADLRERTGLASVTVNITVDDVLTSDQENSAAGHGLPTAPIEPEQP